MLSILLSRLLETGSHTSLCWAQHPLESTDIVLSVFQPSITPLANIAANTELTSVTYCKPQVFLNVKANYFACIYWLAFIVLFSVCNIFPSGKIYVFTRKTTIYSLQNTSLQTLWVLVHWGFADKTANLHLAHCRKTIVLWRKQVVLFHSLIILLFI